MSATEMNILQPGQIIRPQVTEEQAVSLVECLYGLKVTSIKQMNSYDDRNYYIKVADSVNNPHISQLWPHGYVLKVLNSMDSQRKHVDAEHEMQHILLKANFNVPCPVLNLQGQEKSLERILPQNSDRTGLENNNDSIQDSHGQDEKNIVRLLTFIPGKIFFEVPYTADLFWQVGNYIAKVNKALEGYSHDGLRSHKTIWNLTSVPKLRDFVYAVPETWQKNLIGQVLQAFEEEVIPQYDNMEIGVIHGDYNEQNIIVQPKPNQGYQPDVETQYYVHGLIDFGDSLWSYYVFEVAITITYMMVESKIVDPLFVGGHVLAGYLTERPLSDIEFNCLKACVMGRYAQSLVMGHYTYLQDPGNDYVLITAKNGWPQLKRLWETPKEELYNEWRKIIRSYN